MMTKPHPHQGIAKKGFYSFITGLFSLYAQKTVAQEERQQTTIRRIN
jgi:hypothetical protein